MSTRIILVRHAKPVDPSPATPDAQRPLTEEGRVIQKQMAERLKAEGFVVDRILTSPLLRAQQTAQILSEGLGGVVEDEAALAPPFRPREVLAHLQEGQTTLLVGHNPSLADFGNMLLGEPYVPTGLVKSGALVIEFKYSISFGSGKLFNYYKPN